jgi:hypothetical protein
MKSHHPSMSFAKSTFCGIMHDRMMGQAGEGANYHCDRMKTMLARREGQLNKRYSVFNARGGRKKMKTHSKLAHLNGKVRRGVYSTLKLRKRTWQS